MRTKNPRVDGDCTAFQEDAGQATEAPPAKKKRGK
jgi:hypothetical protein